MQAIVPLAVVFAIATASAAAAQPVDPLANASISDLDARLATGQISAEGLVEAYAKRIAALDRAGPQLNSVIALSPDAGRIAHDIDARRKAGWTGPLVGVPILLKDNIEANGAMPTTAGSLALKDNVTGRDAPLTARLRAAGAVILGKTNLSEWANIRSNHSISGWSAIGGLVKNPYALDRTACGSSAGSAAAVTAGFAAAAIGTETDGSITCPAAMNGLVGLKPTVGLVSRTFIVPISASQDTAGPMTRTVEDAAIVLTAIAGSDPSDPATAEADTHKTDYAAGLRVASLKGKRLGVLKYLTGDHAATDAVFAAAVATLKAQGAEVIEIADYRPPSALGADEELVLLTELKAGLNAYLASTPPAVKTRTLADVIAFDQATPRETALFGDDGFEGAQATKGLDDPAYLKAKAEAKRLAGPEGIDELLADNQLDALIAPTTAPPWRIDVVDGDHFSHSASRLPAVAGYPHLTVPMGYVKGLPVGLSFIGAAWSEASLLQLGYAFEQAAHARVPPAFSPSVETEPQTTRAFAPNR
jgi:amidase